MIVFSSRAEDDLSDDVLGGTGLLTGSSAAADDRHTRHIMHDKRLLTAPALRRRLDQLGNHFQCNSFVTSSFVQSKKINDGKVGI
jgi:hypothetical protein